MNKAFRAITAIACGWLAAFASAGTLTVTSPTSDQFLGKNNSLTYNIRQAVVKGTVIATVVGPSGSTILRSDYTPDTDGKASGSLPVNFSETAPQGSYTINVTVEEPGNTYTPVSIGVTVDTLTPKLLNFSPAQGAYVKGTVRVRFDLLEQFMKTWRVTVNNADIPNNSGTTETSLSVDWNSTTLERDGTQTIQLAARDQADNAFNFSINCTVDRLQPSSSIDFPRGDTPLRPRTDINVVVTIRDQFTDSVDITGIDVVLQRTDGTFLGRAARRSFGAQGSNAWQYVGRIRHRSGKLPSSFKVVVTAVDKAGNVATRQEQTINIGSRGRSR